MGQFIFQRTEIEGLAIIEPNVLGDHRGYFMETYNYEDFNREGFNQIFVQDNQSMSKKGVLRGLHFQKNYPQGKLMRVLHGEVFDVAVDIRKNSATFGKWAGVLLSAENKKQFYIPEGFAHGFLVLSETAEIAYKCTNFYHPEDESGILWCDPEINIKWPTESISEILLSERDKRWGTLKELSE